MKLSDKFISAGAEMCAFEKHVAAPYFRKSFNLDFAPESAEITICGLGFYELYINGENITKGPLAPYISNTDDICYYDNYNISDKLKKGTNVIGILLGNGMRNPFGGFVWDSDKARHRGPVTIALCLEAVKGEERVELETDTTFKTHPSPILFDDLRMGYIYDSRFEICGWNECGFDDSEWNNAIETITPKGIKKICSVEPIVERDVLTAASITHYDRLPFAYKDMSVNAKPYEESIRENIYVYDFGINTAGVTMLSINGKPGQRITIRHGESLIDGKFSINSTAFLGRDGYTDEKYINYGQTDVFICKGGEEVFVPKFKYDGFRYAYVEGLEPEQATKDALKYIVMHSDVKAKAEFKCSDSILNKLQECTRRSDLSNMFYFPTDCPHREKNGWTADASFSAEHMLLNLTVENSLKEWLASIRCAQRSDGALPGIIPTVGWGFEWGNGPAWDSVCVNLPYYIYKYTGDKTVIEENASMICRYLKYISSKRDDNGLVAIGLGDWVDPFKNQNGKIAAPLELTDSAMIYDISNKAAFLFNEISYCSESEYAMDIALQMRNAIRSKLIDFETMTVAGNCQTSQALAIEIGIFNGDEIQAARKRLTDIIHRDGDVNACGVIGLRYLFHALTNAGESELAYKLITSNSRSCYGYWIEHGATSLWESFMEEGETGDNSQNHHFLGDISSWFIQELAGIKPNPECNDITYFEISPVFIRSMSYAEAVYKTKNGDLKIMWTQSEGSIKINMTLPSQTHGKILIKNGTLQNGKKHIFWDKEDSEKTMSLIVKLNKS